LTIGHAPSIEDALQHHAAGRLPEAEKLYHKVLRADPNHPDALHLLGVIAHQVGKNDIAAGLISKALDNRPNFAEAHYSLGLTLQKLGRLDDAVACFNKALAINPDYTKAHINLGALLQGQGQFDDAIARYSKALAIAPDDSEAHYNMGVALQKMERLEEAASSYQNALANNPDNFAAHNNLGAVFQDLGKLDEAVASYHQALTKKPDFAQAIYNLGITFQKLGYFNDAVVSYRKALAIDPDYDEAHNNLGNALRDLGEINEAMACFQKAIAINPDYAEAHNNLGTVFQELGQQEEAIEAYRRALRIRPDYEIASVCLLHQLRHACAWREVEELELSVKKFTETSIREGSKVALRPFDNMTTSDNVAENYIIAQAASREIAQRVSGLIPSFPKPGNKGVQSKITIGYLSSDFQNHPVAHLMLGLFELHDRNNFNIIGFSHGQNDASPYREKIVRGCDGFFDLQTVSHLEAAKQISQSGVDILVDLNGHTQNNRLEICALRPAPVQATYLGFPGTSGANFLDYILTDRIVTPEDHSRYYSEQLVYLPHCYQINDHRQKISDIPITKSDFGLPEKGFVFCSFNSNFKIEPVMFDCWMNLLKNVPGSVLWLFKSNELAMRNLKAEAQARGVAAERLIFTDRLPNDQHLARYRLADLVLDTRLCGGHTTTSDALWAGVPVVTLLGNHFASRVSASILSAVGLPELVTKTLEEYEALAFRLSQNRDELDILKANLADKRLNEPLFDTPRFVRNLEIAYRRMWANSLSGAPPSRIDVIEY
jgi:protein O-GlcNAc transferase